MLIQLGNNSRRALVRKSTFHQLPIANGHVPLAPQRIKIQIQMDVGNNGMEWAALEG